MAPTTIKTTRVLITEAMTRFIPIDSKKLQKGVIKKASRIPKSNGIKKGAPKCKMANINMIKKSIVLIFFSLCIVFVYFKAPFIFVPFHSKI